MSHTFPEASELFLQLCDLPADQRDARLRELAVEDRDLHAEVLFLLEGDRAPDTGLDVPAVMHFATDFAAARLPEWIGGYRVVRRIGEGGMGVVFEAEQESPRRRVAVKLMRTMFAGESLQRRFEYEVAVLGKLQHPGIARIIEAGTCDLGVGPQPFFAMEYIDGERLDAYARKSDLDLRDRLELLARICDAAHHAHQRGVIHRDLKPANILVTADGQPKILDFGIAKAVAEEARHTTPHTGSGQIVGTPDYMSPEQVCGRQDELEISSDVYALGVIGFELLSGRLPHDLAGRPLTAVARIITDDDPPLLGTLDRTLRGDVETVIAKALERKKHERYHSAAGLAADIRRHLDDVPILARPHTFFYGLKKFTRRNQAMVFGTLATLLAIIGGSIGTLVFALRASDQEVRARRMAYGLGVRAAANAIDSTRFGSARTFLDDAPAEFRGWEWRHVDSLLKPWQRVLEADVDLVDPIAYTPDGKTLAVTRADGAIGLFDVDSTEQRILAHDGARFVAIANNFPGDRPLLAAGADDGRVFVFDLAAQAPPRVLEGHDKRIEALAWLPDGRLLSAAGMQVRLWRDGQTIHTYRAHVGSASNRFLPELVVAPDGRSFAFAARGAVHQFDVETGKVRSYKTRASPACLTFTPDGTRIIAGTEHQNLHILDAATMLRLDRDFGHDRRTDRLRYAPDGSVLAAVSTDGVLTLRDEIGNIRAAHSRGKRIRGLAFRSDSSQIACADQGGRTITLWDLPLDSALAIRDFQANLSSISWSPDGTLLAAGTERSKLTRLLDPTTGAVLDEIADRSPLGFDDASQRLLLLRPASHKGPQGYFAYDLATGQETALAPGWGVAIARFDERYGLHAGVAHGHPALSPDHRLMVSPESPPKVNRLNDGATIATLGERSLYNMAHAFNHQGTRLLVTEGPMAVALWDATTWQRIGALPAGIHTRKMMGAHYSHDGQRLVTACHDNLVRVFEADSLELVIELEGHTSHVACVAFSPDDSRIASCGGDATVRVWDSVPRAQRDAAVRAATKLRDALRPRLAEWLRETTDPDQLAERLRAAPVAERPALLRLLIERRS